jgi:hypothetical protein
MPSSLTPQIDAGILAVAQNRWRKVALIIASVLRDMDDSVSAEEVANRIQVLVANGQLVSQGDLARWRHSEVRLAGAIPDLLSGS